MELNKQKLQEIGNLFRLPGEVKSFEEINDGTHNFSYKVKYSTNKFYTFQRISLPDGIDPDSILKNVELITKYLKNKNLISVHYHHTNYKKNYIVVDGDYWRVSKYYDFNNVEITSLDAIENIGRSAASFQFALKDFDISQLDNSFSRKHNTAYFFELMKSIDLEEARYIDSVSKKALKVYNSYVNGDFPSRVVHNKPKTGNMFFGNDVKDPVMIVDVDSVSSGISVYDFALGALSACRNREKHIFDLERFEAYFKGFISVAKLFYTKTEISLMYDAIYAVALEAAAYNLDRYANAGKEKRLEKCRNYIALAKDVESKKNDIENIISKLTKSVKAIKNCLKDFERDSVDNKKDYKAGEYMNIVIPHNIKPKGGWWYAFTKRLFDIFCSFLALIVLSPIMLIVGLIVVLSSPGPMIYVSKRVGKNGKIFNFYKFRSMYKDAEQRLDELLSKNEVQGGITFKMKDDPRITPFGKFIRKTSLDELPQLVNILKGDMSIIGPRAGLPRDVSLSLVPIG